MDKNLERIINLVEELGEKKTTPISMEEYQQIINKGSMLMMSNGIDEALSFIISYFNFIK